MTRLPAHQDAASTAPAVDGSTSAPAAPPPAIWSLGLSDASQLVKPRITLMVLITTFIGFVMAHRAVYNTDSMYDAIQLRTFLLIMTLLGTSLSCMGASALNQTYERDTDGMMHRTRSRPLPAGRVNLMTAAVLGLLLSVAGVLVLAIWVNLLTAAISALTIFSYTLIYTPLKRVTSLSTIVGAVPGALPPVMGYTAVADRVGIEALLLFGILFLWQLPHFLAIAWLYREDYARANMPMLPVLDPDGRSTFRQILVSCVVLVPLGLLPTIFHVSGKVYFVGAFICGLAFLGFGVALVRGRTRAHARAMFFASLVYLPVVLGLMMADQL